MEMAKIVIVTMTLFCVQRMIVSPLFESGGVGSCNVSRCTVSSEGWSLTGRLTASRQNTA